MHRNSDEGHVGVYHLTSALRGKKRSGYNNRNRETCGFPPSLKVGVLLVRHTPAIYIHTLGKWFYWIIIFSVYEACSSNELRRLPSSFMETGQLLTRVNMKRDYDQSLYDQALNSIYSSLKFEARKFGDGVSMPIYTKMGLQLLQSIVAPWVPSLVPCLRTCVAPTTVCQPGKAVLYLLRRIPWGQGCGVAETFLHAMDFRLMPFQLGP